jgi:hypothetical protein
MTPFSSRKQLLRVCEVAFVASVATSPNEAVNNFVASTMVTLVNIQSVSASRVADAAVLEYKSIVELVLRDPGLVALWTGIGETFYKVEGDRMLKWLTSSLLNCAAAVEHGMVGVN